MLPAQSTADQAHGQFSRVQQDLNASTGRQTAQQAHLIHVHGVKAVGTASRFGLASLRFQVLWIWFGSHAFGHRLPFKTSRGS